jgi:NADH-quinone oxidoreductase subunit N
VIAALAQLAQVAPPPDIVTPDVAWRVVMPEMVLIGGALVLLVVGALSRAKPVRGSYALYTVGVAAGSLVASAVLWSDVSDGKAKSAIADAVVVDGFAVFFAVLIALTVAVVAMLAEDYLRRENLDAPEFFVLLLLSASGGQLMAAANDLIVLFLGLEILSISLYVLAGFHSRRAESQEAAMKYFVLGAFSSAFLLYGIALVYGATGSTQLPEIAEYLRANVLPSSGLLLAGIALIIVGFGFKTASVPFHMWTPDVYQGAPSPVTGFMAAASKAAAFAGLLRVLFSTFTLYRLDWQPIIWGLAVVTLLVGSVVAIVQTDVKRMLAYSSIAHAGYVLVGLQAATDRGVAGALFYLFAYTFMVLGSFGVVTLVGRAGDAAHGLDAYKGMARRRPMLALVFTIFLLAQAGVPLTSGFLAKFYVIGAAVDTDAYGLAVIAMIAAIISVFFYLRIILTMYSGDPAEAEPDTPVEIPLLSGAAIGFSLAVTVFFGVLPSVLVDFARDATILFF